MTAHATINTNDSVLIRGLSGLMYDTHHEDAPKPHHVDLEVSVVGCERRYRVCVIAPDEHNQAAYIYDGQGVMIPDSAGLWKGTIEEGVIHALRIILAACQVPETVR